MMVSMFRRCVWFVVALLIGACASLTPSGSEQSSELIAPQVQSAQQVAERFLQAWGDQAYPAMYELIAPQSQSLYSLEVFAQNYQDTANTIGLDGVTYTIGDVTEQGTTTAIVYDLSFESRIYGQIADNNRRMRLVNVGTGWRVAWSRMDIFEGLAPETILETVTDRAPRGHLLDRDGDFIVEQDGTVVTVLLQRSRMANEVDCYTSVARIFRRDYDDLIAQAESFNAFDTQYPVGDLDPQIYAANELELIENCGIQSYERQTRRYVGHGAAAHITGAIGQIQADEIEFWRSRGYDAGDLVGTTGLERQYEEVLAGEPERILRIREPGGAVVREIARVSGRAPQNITLTLDADLQIAAGQALADAYNYASPNWAATGRSAGGAVVVLDVRTGAVLAMSSWPTYDPGIFNPDTPLFNAGQFILQLAGDSRRPFFDRAIQEQYPPGSTFKIITTLAALSEGVWQPSEVFYCDLFWQGQSFGDTLEERPDWRSFESEERRVPTGDVTPALALASSCNPFYYQMGALLYRRGPSLLMDYARRMGLGAATGFDLNVPQEAVGQVPALRGTDDAISSAIGQGNVQVTILQMARMVASVANGGTLYRPYIVQQVGEDAPYIPSGMSQIAINEAVIREVQSGMCTVTTNTQYGTAAYVFGDEDNNIPSTPYIACGKTGTAQTGREPHGWFVAYAPADNPEVAIAVMIENSREGSETAAPIARRILDAYFQVPPELVARYPDWWTGEYVPLPLPEGTTGG